MVTEKVENVIKSEYMKMIRGKVQHKSNRQWGLLDHVSKVERRTSGKKVKVWSQPRKRQLEVLKKLGTKA